jgi:adenylate cyclase
MDYDSISPAYRQSQLLRLRSYVDRIAHKGILPGRALPDDDSLRLGEGRRMRMSIMFVDICAFSSRMSETDSEQAQIMKALAIFFAEMIKVCSDYGAEVEKNTGDGLMAWFKDNDGDPPENCSKRAVAAALTMFDINDRGIRPLFREADIEPFDFRVAIDTGPVTIAKLGAARHFSSNVAVGTTANCASKLMRFAGANELVIGNAVYQELPVSWRQWARVIDEPTGWEYRTTGKPYLAHKYIGRWK